MVGEVFVPCATWRGDWADEPRFAHLADRLRAFADCRDWPDAERLSAESARLGLVSCAGAPIRFVLQRHGATRGGDVLASRYDVRIHREGAVSTRPRNAHDFFNAMVWLSFPRAKAALSARQHDAWCERLAPGQRRLPGARTREQDTLSMLDEGGILVVPHGVDPGDVDAALAARDSAAVSRWARAGELTVAAFGHALYEHVASGDPAVRGLAVVLDRAASRDGARDAADAMFSARLADRACFCDPSGLHALSH